MKTTLQKLHLDLTKFNRKIKVFKLKTKNLRRKKYFNWNVSAGKILWFSGAPGMGKSTTAQMLARDHGYVYYEADCFGSIRNPFVPLEAEDPSMAQFKQKNLRGPGLEERKAAIDQSKDTWTNCLSGKEYDADQMNEYYRHMALDIAGQKERIGGHWAVASILVSKRVRSYLRSVLGPDLVILCLTMSDSERRQRILQRHAGDTNSADWMDVSKHHGVSLLDKIVILL